MSLLARRWPALALFPGLLLAALPVTASPAGADAANDAVVYQSLTGELARNTTLLTSVSTQLDEATTELVGITNTLTDTHRQLDATRDQITVLKQILRARAAFIYQHNSQANSAVTDIAHVQDLAVGRKYVDAATTTDTTRLNQLGKLADDLDQRAQQLDAQRQEAQAARDRLDRQKSTLVALTNRLSKLLTGAGAVAVMGDPDLGAAQIGAWFDSHANKYRLAGGLAITDLAQMYIDEGKAEHVRPELAFVQAVLETGWFKYALDNNYAGIGACDSCTGEPAFASPRDGVRGQIQMLRNYADPGSRAANLAHPPSPTIYGSNPSVAATSYDSFFAKGRVPTWNLMGNGNWATSTTYASKVLTLYFDLVTYATIHA